MKVKPKPSRLRIGLSVLAISLIGFGGWGFWQQIRVTFLPAPALPSQPVTMSVAVPSEAHLPDTCPGLEAPADTPRWIELPSLGIAGCIHQVGTDEAGRIAVPVNIHAAGWFTHSALPGSKGVSIIDGHAQGRYQPGIFKHLNKLQPGQHIRVQTGDLSWKEFEVVTIQSFPESQADKEQFRQLSEVERQLTLITCDGKYNREKATYEQRVIVRAGMR